MSRPNGVALALPNQSSGRVGQATQIEQSRAAAEVYASVLAAKQVPRDSYAAQAAMAEVCKMPALAERAFFRFPRAGGAVTGPTVHLARELARCWGNIHYGVAELRRDDQHGQSEMQAFAWDLETNARNSAVFVVPHKRDKKDGPEALTDMRDIYESNANAGARRVRECIFAVLPLWFVEDAKDRCTETLNKGGGKPLPQRISEAIRNFAELGVRQEQLEAKVGQPSARWVEQDVTTLGLAFRSIQRGEVRKEDEFPSPAGPQVRAADLVRPAAEHREAEAATQSANQSQMRRIFALLKKRGIGEGDRLAAASMALERDIVSFKDLTADDASRLIARLEQADEPPAEQPPAEDTTEGEQQ